MFAGLENPQVGHALVGGVEMTSVSDSKSSIPSNR